jgi:hypothetical protein
MPKFHDPEHYDNDEHTGYKQIFIASTGRVATFQNSAIV